MAHLCSLGRDITVTSVTCDITLEEEIGLIGFCKYIQNKDDEPNFFEKRCIILSTEKCTVN